MAARRRRKNDAASRLMRQAVAYDRLAAKAFHNGRPAEARRYNDQSIRLRTRAARIRERSA